MRLPHVLVAATLAAAALVASPRPARAVIVERVVAVVGERPIFWSELVRRAAVPRLQIRAALLQRSGTVSTNVVTAQESEMYKELLDRMVDDRLEEQQAARAHVSVTADEIDRGISTLAAQAERQMGRPVTVAAFLAEVISRGSTEQEFRDEIRRQLLEGKLVELRVRPRVRVTDEDARAAYRRWVAELSEQQPSARAPAFEDVQPQMTQRALYESIEHACQEWLRELRRGTYVDVRL